MNIKCPLVRLALAHMYVSYGKIKAIKLYYDSWKFLQDETKTYSVFQMGLGECKRDVEKLFPTIDFARVYIAKQSAGQTFHVPTSKFEQGGITYELPDWIIPVETDLDPAPVINLGITEAEPTQGQGRGRGRPRKDK